MHKKDKNAEDDEYQIDQANLIRNLNDNLMKVIVSPLKIIFVISHRIQYENRRMTPIKLK